MCTEIALYYNLNIMLDIFTLCNLFFSTKNVNAICSTEDNILNEINTKGLSDKTKPKINYERSRKTLIHVYPSQKDHWLLIIFFHKNFWDWQNNSLKFQNNTFSKILLKKYWCCFSKTNQNPWEPIPIKVRIEK